MSFRFTNKFNILIFILINNIHFGQLGYYFLSGAKIKKVSNSINASILNYQTTQ